MPVEGDGSFLVGPSTSDSDSWKHSVIACRLYLDHNSPIGTSQLMWFCFLLIQSGMLARV